jgi:hypothetical protein
MVAIPNMNRRPQALNQAQVIREYIWCQEQEDRRLDQLRLW